MHENYNTICFCLSPTRGCLSESVSLTKYLTLSYDGL